MEFKDVDGDMAWVEAEDGVVKVFVGFSRREFTPTTARAIAAELIRLADEIDGTQSAAAINGVGK